MRFIGFVPGAVNSFVLVYNKVSVQIFSNKLIKQESPCTTP